MNEKQKGFTLVELAIVLVVIGLLLGMAFKGKSLIDAARIKTDIYKVEKIETALNTYYSKYNTLPGKDPETGKITGGRMFDDLIKEGMISVKDYKVNSMKTYYHFVPCKSVTTSIYSGGTPKPGDLYWANLHAFDENEGICLGTEDSDPRNDIDPSVFDNIRQTNEMICYEETLLDDQNAYGGDGRRVMRDQDEPEIKDCAKAKALDETKGTKYAYFYKVF